MSEIIDQLEDPPLKAIADLLERSIVTEWGRAALAENAVYMHDVPPDKLLNRLPALIVVRDEDSTKDDGDDGSDDESVTLVIGYFLPAASAERLALRVPFLRAVWKRIYRCLHAGFDPRVEPHHVNDAGSHEPERMIPVLGAAGWRVPARPKTLVKYSVEASSTDPIPCFRATVTMRTTRDFDWLFAGTWSHPDIEGVDSDVRAHAPTSGEPDATQPGYTQSITFD